MKKINKKAQYHQIKKSKNGTLENRKIKLRKRNMMIRNDAIAQDEHRSNQVFGKVMEKRKVFVEN